MPYLIFSSTRNSILEGDENLILFKIKNNNSPLVNSVSSSISITQKAKKWRKCDFLLVSSYISEQSNRRLAINSKATYEKPSIISNQKEAERRTA